MSSRSSLPPHLGAGPSGVGGIGFHTNSPLRGGIGKGHIRPAMSRLNEPGHAATPSSSSSASAAETFAGRAGLRTLDGSVGGVEAKSRGAATGANLASALARATPRRQEIQRNVHLFTYTLSEPTRFHYEVECTKYQRVAVTICFDGSENVLLEKYPQSRTPQPGEAGEARSGTVALDVDEGPLRCTVVAAPFKRVTVGTLSIRDVRSKTHLKIGYKLKVLPPDERLFGAAVMRDADSIKEALHGARYARLESHNTLQSLNKACGEYNVSFVDADFPPGPAALGFPDTSLSTSVADAASSSNPSVGTGGAAELLDAISATAVPASLAKSADCAAADVKAFLSFFSPNRITWRRPYDFLGRNYDLFQQSDAGADDEITADIRPGRLGNFWLLGALACMAERPSLIKRVFRVPGEGRHSEQRNAYGAYKLRLCKHGAWSDVLVDDYFPCSPGGGPVFSRSSGAELWVLLVEKAFAKLHGGYAFLRGARGGWVHQALADLTGAPTEFVRFDVKFDDKSLWEDMVEHDQQEQLMCACTKGEDPWADWNSPAAASARNLDPVAAASEVILNREKICAAAYTRGDLIPGHAYAVLAVKETRYGDRLVRVRNPWGRVDWTGDWSPTSSKWTQETLADVFDGPPRGRLAVAAPGLTEDEKASAKGSTDAGGSFWMCWSDFLKKFASITICRIHSNSGVSPIHTSKLLQHAPSKAPPRPESWDEQRVRGYFLCNGADQFRQGVDTQQEQTKAKTNDAKGDAVDWKNHPVKTAMYVMDVPCDTETSIVITLHQQDYGVAGSKPYIDAGLTVMSLTEDGQSFTVVPGGSSGCQVAREVSVEVNLRAGRYVVVPVSSGAVFRHGLHVASEASGAEQGPSVGGENVLPLTRMREAQTPSVFDSLQTKAEEEQQKFDEYTSKHVFLPAAEMAFLEIFARLDEDMDGVLSRKELDHFMLLSEGAAMQPKVYEWIMSTFECGSLGAHSDVVGDDEIKGGNVGLTARGFLALYMYIFESGGADEALLWRDLKFMGYDDKLDLVGARSFVLSTHAPAGCALVLTKVPYDREAFTAALETPVKSDAEMREALDTDHDVILCRRSAGNWGVSFAVQNASGVSKNEGENVEDEEDDLDPGQTLVFTLDCSASHNVVSHAGALKHTVRVAPGGDIQLIHHLVPEVQGAWQWKYEASWVWEGADAESEEELG